MSVDPIEVSDWLTTEQAADVLCMSLCTLRSSTRDIAQAVRRKHRRLASTQGFQYGGALWNLEDLLRVKRVRQVARTSIGVAARIAAAMREGRI
jgi:hypothetical protein